MPLNELCLDDFAASARKVLPRSLFAFVEAGSERNRTRDANREAFSRCALIPRNARDVSGRSAKTTLLGREMSAPFGIAPMGMAGACRFEGDLRLARAAGEAGIPFVLSGASFEPMERVAQEAPGSWFQAYLSGNSDRDLALVQRVERAGYETLVITLDTPVPPSREASMRVGGLGVPVRLSPRLVGDALMHPRWLAGTGLRTLQRKGIPRMANTVADGPGPSIAAKPSGARSVRDSLQWDAIRTIRDAWTGTLVLKGILAAEDAVQAAKICADAVIVSNHGGRQLDGTIAALDALPAVKRASGNMGIYLDGGIRRGSDILCALATGADFVFVGRPFLYALAAHGEEGVTHAIALLRNELTRGLALLGATSPDEVDGRYLGGKKSA